MIKGIFDYFRILWKSIFENGLSIILLSIIIAILSYFWKIYNDTVYTPWIITSITAAIIILVFVDTFIKNRDEKNEILNIKKQLLRANKLLTIYIDKYTFYARTITNPYDDTTDSPLEQNFEFKRLAAIFNYSLLITDKSLDKKAFDYYFDAQRNIIWVIKDILLNVDLKWYPEFLKLEKLLISYLESICILDLYDGIKSDYLSVWINGETKVEHRIKDFIIELIKSTETTELKDHANAINLYVLLYKQINYNLGFIDDYKSEIIKLNNN